MDWQRAKVERGEVLIAQRREVRIVAMPFSLAILSYPITFNFMG